MSISLIRWWLQRSLVRPKRFVLPHTQARQRSTNKKEIKKFIFFGAQQQQKNTDPHPPTNNFFSPKRQTNMTNKTWNDVIWYDIWWVTIDSTRSKSIGHIQTTSQCMARLQVHPWTESKSTVKVHCSPSVGGRGTVQVEDPTGGWSWGHEEFHYCHRAQLV